MKRAAFLLLLVFGAWLLAAPASRIPAPRTEPPAVSASGDKADAGIEQLRPPSAASHVARAPRLARLPTAPFTLPRGSLRFARRAAFEPVRDLRRALRRVEKRRRIPRLSGGEPPWS